MKLLDILFVWGKEGRFLTEAKVLRTLVDEDAAEWGRVAIMGRQICPDETLFAGQGGAGIDVAVDATEAGETTAAASDSLDFDIGADETSVADDDLIDFDLGVTGERPAVRREGVSPDQTAELEIEDLGLDLDLGDATGEVLAGLAAAAGETGVDIDLEGLGADGESPRRDVGDTAEVLGLQSADAGDTAELTTLGETMAREAIDEEDQTEVYGGMDEPTELAPMPDSDDRTARLERADVTEASHAADEEEASLSLDVGLTGLTEILEATTKIGDEGATVVAQTVEMPSSKSTDDDLEDYSSQVEQPDFSTRRLEAVVDESDLDDDDTAEVEAIKEADPRLDLDDLTAALSADLERSEGSDEAGDLRDGDDLIGEIFGGQEETTRIAPGFEVLTARDAPAQKEYKLEAAPPDVTLDEVGTKLDLARAYIDMGDPDGARSILEEVLSEGNDRQRDEAQQLMDGVT
jgi:pilus assembly protein FimV